MYNHCFQKSLFYLLSVSVAPVLLNNILHFGGRRDQRQGFYCLDFLLEGISCSIPPLETSEDMGNGMRANLVFPCEIQRICLFKTSTVNPQQKAAKVPRCPSLRAPDSTHGFTKMPFLCSVPCTVAVNSSQATRATP